MVRCDSGRVEVVVLVVVVVHRPFGQLAAGVRTPAGSEGAGGEEDLVEQTWQCRP